MIKRVILATLLGLCVLSDSAESMAGVKAMEIEDLGEPGIHIDEPDMEKKGRKKSKLSKEDINRKKREKKAANRKI